MNKTLAGALLAALGFVSLPAFAADSPDGLWHEVNPNAIARNGRDREIVPDVYRAFELNRGRLTAALATAPRESDQQRPGNSKLTVRLPLPGGGYGNFKIVESPVMAPELAAKFPQIKTYLGQDVDDKSTTVRFDVTPKGFHAQILSREGTLYVDPFQPGDVDHYIAYRKADHTHGHRGVCAVTGELVGSAEDTVKHLGIKLSAGATLRTYRLAMAATGEYTAYHGGTVADGLAAIVTTVNRVDGIYEREVSVRMVLVANDDQLIYTNAATDPYANTSGDLNANQSNTDAVIGSANYDIGHLVGTGGGGIAGLGVVCKNTTKAQGLTGSSAPVADGYDVDYVAHEMGHQFGGNHTFNGSGGSCAGGNRSAAHAYEPGSGLTIQAYAGICGGDDLQPNSDDYFHRESLNEIITYTTTGTGGTCGTTSATGNAIPTVTTPAAFTIPGRTPFTLTAAGADADNDPLTYVWEEYDLGAANAEGVLDPTLIYPIFRGFDPSPDPTRTFPSLRYILANANAVPATAPLPGTTSPAWMAGEVLPNVNRTMNFRVTVRDNKAGGGGTNEASTAITIANAAGPFAVTAPNTAVTWTSGSTQTVTWNVAGTTAAPVSTANVKISLSTDGGYTFPIVLAASTPNDGTESITVPAGTATTQARVKVEAVGNVYFDISDASFTITDAGNSAPAINVTGSVATTQGGPTASAVVATVSDAQDAAGALTVAVTGAPSELAVSVTNTGGNVTLSATALCTLVAPTTGAKAYPLVLRVTDSAGATSTAEVVVNVGSNKTPTLGNYANISTIQGATRIDTPSALAADANNNFTGTSVTPTTLPGGGTVAIAADGTVTVTTTASTTLGTYVVRPSASDSCGAVETRQFNVIVGAPAVTLNVASPTVTTGNGLIEPFECNALDISVRNDGNIPATNVSAVLATSTPNVTITQAASAYVDIPPGESRANTTAYQVSTTGALTCFTNIAFTLTLTYSQAGSPVTKSFNVTVGQPLGTNYVFTASSGATLPNDGVLLAGSQLDDGLVSLVVPAGFNFSVYGTAVTGGTTLRASSNGNLQFRPTQGASDANNGALPATGAGNGQAVFPAAAATLFLQWDDWRMDGAAGGAALDAGIYTKLQGTAPNREWIIEWRGRIRGDGATTTNNNRAAIVFHEGSNSFDYIYLLTGAGASANGAGSTIGVQGASTGTTFTQYALDNAFLTPGTKLTAAIPPAICASGSGYCGFNPTVSLVETGGSTAIAEGGATDTYSIVLGAQPGANVVVTPAPDAQATVFPPSVTFTTSNWNTPQTITVTAVDDAVTEGTHSGTIAHAASGGGYSGVSIANVVATITDNDPPGVTLVESGGSTNVAEGGATDTYTIRLNTQPSGPVTIAISPDAQLTTNPTSLLFDASDWQIPKTVTVTAVDDNVFEQAHTGTITHSATGGAYGSVVIPNVTASITDNDVRVADLAVTDTLLNAPATPSKRLNYEVSVDNLTAGADVGAAQFTFTLSPVFTNVSWTCVADPGASCPASGSGPISHSLVLAGGTGVLYSIGADIPAATPAGTTLVTNAAIAVAAPYQDNVPGNNNASTSDNVVVTADDIFKDGFE